MSARIRPLLRRLEDRDAPATFTVNSDASDGFSSFHNGEPETVSGAVTVASIFGWMNQTHQSCTIKFAQGFDIHGDFMYLGGGVTVSGIDTGGAPSVTIHGSITLGSNNTVRDLAITGAFGNGLNVKGNNKIIHNVITASGGYGIGLSGSGNLVTGNYVGVDSDGVTAKGNLNGVLIIGPGNTIGGSTAVARNVISGNIQNGIVMLAGSGFNANNCVVQGNYIGVSADGSTPRANGIAASDFNKGFGIIVEGSGNLIGGAKPEQRNVIASKGAYGAIEVTSQTALTNGTKIIGNYLNTTIDGQGMFTAPSDDPGALVGIGLGGGIGNNFTVIQNNVIGDSRRGLEIGGGGTLTSTQIVNNMIGVSADGQKALRNKDGIVLLGATGLRIGGSTAGTRNTISGNTHDGILLDEGSNKNQIYGNYIGTNFAGDKLGNGVHGVEIKKGAHNFIGFTNPIGAPTSSFANTIAFNGFDEGKLMTADDRGHAVQIDNDTNNIGNTIRGNIFHDNKALSIYLDDPNHHNELPQNDVAFAYFDKPADRTIIAKLPDQDLGANNLQNFPVIQSIDTAKKLMVWQLNTDKAAAYTIDFYSDDQLGDLGYGGGQKFLFTKTMHTNALGHGEDVVIPLVPGQHISATATDASGNTSSFSIVDTRGDGIADAWITKGIDFDMTGNSILNLPNADMTRRNLYLQMDAMSGVVGVSLGNVFSKLHDVFNNSPVLNANGPSGVNLQINPDGGPQSVPFSTNWAGVWTDFENAKQQAFGAGLDAVQKKARAMVYRYGVFINHFGNDGSSGFAEATIVNSAKAPNGLGYQALGGNDFMVALPSDWWTFSKTPLNTVSESDLEGTMMHEFGHTLGLLHGGTDLENYKPNYYSIMNYDWQMPGMAYRMGWINTDNSANWTLDYSRKALGTIDENATGNFDIGFAPPGLSVAVPRVFQSTKAHWYVGPAGRVTYRLVPMTGAVPRVTIPTSDPNYAKLGLNGKADLNYGGDADKKVALTKLFGAEDWSHLIYNFRESPSYADGQHGAEANELNNPNDTPAPVDPIVTGADAGSPSRVQVYGPDGQVTMDFVAFAGFTGGVRVAKGDVNGDTVADIIAAMGPGGGSVAVFDGTNGAALYPPVQPYGAAFTGGINVAAGDVDGDGHVDIIVAPASGVGSNVLILDGLTGATQRTILAYATSTKTGVTVATGDVNGDGKADIIVAPGSGASPLVKVFNGPDGKFMKSFGVQSPAYNGVYLAAADLDGDGKADIIAGAGGGTGTSLMPLVRVYSGANPATILTAYLADDNSAFHGGVRVGVVKTADGTYDLLTTTGPGEQPILRRFHGLSLAENWETPLFDNTFSGAFVG